MNPLPPPPPNRPPAPDLIARWRPGNTILRRIEELQRKADDAERSTS